MTPTLTAFASVFTVAAGVDALHAALVATGCPIELTPQDFS